MQLINLLKTKGFLLLLLVLFFCVAPLVSRSETIDELQTKIDSEKRKIEEIDREIKELLKKVNLTSAEAKTLQSTINNLNATKKTLETKIKKTDAVITERELNIKKLSLEIVDKKTQIEITNDALADSIKELSILEDRSFFEFLFSNDSISNFTRDLISLGSVKNKLSQTKNKLLGLHQDLNNKKTEEEKTKEELKKQQITLSGQKESVELTKKEKDSLLVVTKNQESQYKAVLAEKERQKRDFLNTLNDIESKLNLLVDPGSFPIAKNGIIHWPLDKVIITQKFGGTQFAKQNPGIYSRPYHPGLDMGTPIGSEVKSVLGGTIKGTGNTDAYPGCYAWGKWILVQHDNGLSSLYAHLSSILVSPGQKVSDSEVIALSGNSGVSTGPHLHLSLYATQGVFIAKYGAQKPSGVGCSATDAYGIFADQDAYLDPETYLP